MTQQDARPPHAALNTAQRLTRVAIALGTPGKPAPDIELAKLLGASRASVWRWRSGIAEPLPNFLQNIERLELGLNLSLGNATKKA